ncbi:hypothetical protein GCM10010123_25760 [Pilimelia anulata]|uniref:ABC transporter permease n=2 Tax=Pilimelia anulata TaxID=53371 RepID=A0A8J3B7E3_9ACTN|nr:hypothetical protein GCM10010123_25760 [Pilimelia anulata]
MIGDADEDLGIPALTHVDATASLYTAGTIPSLILTMLLGVVVMTSEYQHRTAAAAFLLAPRRAPIVLAKVSAMALVSTAWALLIVLLNFFVGVLPLREQLGGLHVSDSRIILPIIGMVLAHSLWAAIGVGFGVLMRSQALACVTSISITFFGTIAALMVTSLAGVFGAWVEDAAIAFPTLATLSMVSAEGAGSVSSLVGALVLVAWALFCTVGGIVLLRRRDVT